MLDADMCNDIVAEDKQVRKHEAQMMSAVSTALHNLYPKCDIEITASLALEGLSEEDLVF